MRKISEISPRKITIIVAAVLLIASFTFFLVRQYGDRDYASLDVIVNAAREGDIARLLIRQDRVEVLLQDNTTITALKETGISFLTTLNDLGVSQLDTIEMQIAPPGIWQRMGPILFALLPLLLIGVFFLFIFRQAQSMGNQTFSFGRSRARKTDGADMNITFADVAGNEEAKIELEEVVEFLKSPERFLMLGARIPKGVLLVGPPGTGKTLMAKAVAGEAGVPFFTISGSEFVEMFVGVGARRVRDLFNQATNNAPCIVFVDEIDAVGRRRGAGMGGSHDEREQTLNQILVEMDGFDTGTDIIVMAATNRPDILDPALMRPGRFDRRVTMDAPDVKGRRAILDVHVKGKPLAPEINLDTVAKRTVGFVGADIENLVNEAALFAARHDRQQITMRDFEEAIERVRVGPERKSRQVTAREREILAYHHAGHGLVMHYLPDHDPVHKITIVPRGMKGGYSRSLPEVETQLYTVEKLHALLAANLGGHTAEMQHFGEVTTESTDDLDMVTKLARTMITQWGMSDRLGPIQYGHREELVFLGSEITEYRNYGEKTAESIDEEVQALVASAQDQAQTILAAHSDQLDLVAAYLLEHETLEADEFLALLEGRLSLDGNMPPQAQPEASPQAPASAHSDPAAQGNEMPDEEVGLGGSTVPAPV